MGFNGKLNTTSEREEQNTFECAEVKSQSQRQCFFWPALRKLAFGPRFTADLKGAGRGIEIGEKFKIRPTVAFQAFVNDNYIEKQRKPRNWNRNWHLIAVKSAIDLCMT